jgi:hypothetical protein
MNDKPGQWGNRMQSSHPGPDEICELSIKRPKKSENVIPKSPKK